MATAPWGCLAVTSGWLCEWTVFRLLGGERKVQGRNEEPSQRAAGHKDPLDSKRRGVTKSRWSIKRSVANSRGLQTAVGHKHACCSLARHSWEGSMRQQREREREREREPRRRERERVRGRMEGGGCILVDIRWRLVVDLHMMRQILEFGIRRT